jgi:anti-anti-sigma factor
LNSPNFFPFLTKIRDVIPPEKSDYLMEAVPSLRRLPMTIQINARRRNLECKMAFQVERGPHFLTVALKGEASFEQAEVISAELLRIPLGAYSLVVLDLAELTFLSSLAMGTLVEYRRGLGRRGVEVRLANVQAQVWVALELAGLWELFQPLDLEQQTRPAASAVA